MNQSFFSNCLKALFAVAAIAALMIILPACQQAGKGSMAHGRESRMIDGKKTISFEEALEGRGMFRPEAPAPSGIIWLPGGDSYLYQMTEGEGGERVTRLHKYDCASGESEVIANWNEVQEKMDKLVSERSNGGMNDVNLSGRVNYRAMTLSDDGSMLLGSHNHDIYIYYLNSGEIKFITNDPETEIWPTFSPDGSKVAYAKDRDIYVVDVNSGGVKRLTDRGGNDKIYNGVPDWVYDEEFGLRRAFWWSGDSSKIAFLQFNTTPIKTFPIVDNLELVPSIEMQQYPKAGADNSVVRLGSIDVSSGGISWIATREDNDSYIARVGWLPDSSRIWYQWVDRDQTTIKLKFANPSTGQSNTILEDVDEAWIDVEDNFRFVNNDTFIWTSDSSGWKHIYVYKIDGIMERQLTDGEWEVKSVAGFDANKEYVYFTSTAVSPMEQHIHRVSLAGGEPEQLSEGEGWHSINMADAGDYYIAYYSGPRTPNVVNIHDGAGKLLRQEFDSASPKLDEYAIAYPEYFTVKTDDGVDLNAYMIKPADFDAEKKYPVLMYIYGGPGSQAVTKRHMVSPWQQYLINRGVIVFRLDNRGTASRGRDFMKIVHRKLGEYELKDHLAGINYLKTLPYVDADRIAVEGYSYGGYMTLYCLTKAPDVFHCGVSGAPVTDWRFYDTIYTERYMDRPQDNPEGYKESAPINFAENMTGHLLITHGTMDNNVHMANSVVMIENLLKAGKVFNFMIYPRERHGIRTSYRSQHRYIMINDFYEKYLLQ